MNIILNQLIKVSLLLFVIKMVALSAATPSKISNDTLIVGVPNLNTNITMQYGDGNTNRGATRYNRSAKKMAYSNDGTTFTNFDDLGGMTLGTANGLSLTDKVLSLGQSSLTTTGALSNANFVIFNNKQDAIPSNTMANWNLAFSWGNHANAGYLTAETDPAFNSSVAKNISQDNVNTWNSKESAIAKSSLTAYNPITVSNGSQIIGSSAVVISCNTAGQNTAGCLTDADWRTFNSKQNAITNNITGTGTANQVPYFSDNSNLIGSTNLTWDNTNFVINGNLNVVQSINQTNSNYYNTFNGFTGFNMTPTNTQYLNSPIQALSPSTVYTSSIFLKNNFTYTGSSNKINMLGFYSSGGILEARIGMMDIVGTGSGTLRLNYAAGSHAFTYGPSGSITVGMLLDYNGQFIIEPNTNGTMVERANIIGPASTATYLKLGNATTGKTVSDGFNLGVNATGEAQVWNKENTNITFYTNNTNRVTISNTGNVGIGVSAPVAGLHIDAPTGIASGIQFSNNVTGQTVSEGASIFLSADTGTLNIMNRENYGITFGTNWSNYLYLASTGNLGVKDGDPQYPLSVGGASLLNGLIYGSNLDNGNMTLSSTTSATKKFIYLGTAFNAGYNEAANTMYAGNANYASTLNEALVVSKLQVANQFLMRINNPVATSTANNAGSAITWSMSGTDLGYIGLVNGAQATFGGGTTFTLQGKNGILIKPNGTASTMIWTTGANFWDDNAAIAPVARIHADSGSNTNTFIKVGMNAQTGRTATDGFDFGMAQDTAGVTPDGIIKNWENTNIRFFTNAVEVVKIDNTGKVGIGTTAPTNMLDINSNNFRLRTLVANGSNSNSTVCSAGTISFSATYLYYCDNTNHTVRTSLTAW